MSKQIWMHFFLEVAIKICIIMQITRRTFIQAMITEARGVFQNASFRSLTVWCTPKSRTAISH